MLSELALRSRNTIGTHGQLSVSFVIQVAIGFILMIAVIYTVYSMENNYKKQSQEQMLIRVADLVASETMRGIDYIEEGSIIRKNLRLPMSKDVYSGQYSIQFATENNMILVQANSSRWHDIIARRPMYLNASEVIYAGGVASPTRMCLKIERNSTNYILNITCQAD